VHKVPPSLVFVLDTFGDVTGDQYGCLLSHAQTIRSVVEQGVLAEQSGVDRFGIGEHHSEDFPVSAGDVVLAAILACTSRIRLSVRPSRFLAETGDAHFARATARRVIHIEMHATLHMGFQLRNPTLKNSPRRPEPARVQHQPCRHHPHDRRSRGIRAVRAALERRTWSLRDSSSRDGGRRRPGQLRAPRGHLPVGATQSRSAGFSRSGLRP